MKEHLYIKKLAKENDDYRRVLLTGPNSQLVLMCLPAGEETGDEIHPTQDLLIYVEEGKAELCLEGRLVNLDEHEIVLVPSGAKHNLKNIGKRAVRLFTVFAPPVYADGWMQPHRAEVVGHDR